LLAVRRRSADDAAGRHSLPKEIPVSDPAPPVRVERYVSLAIGAVLLVIAVSLWGWNVRLAVAGLRTPAGWPPGLGNLILPVTITSLVVGIGAWRILKLGLPERVAGLPLGWALMLLFGLASAIGAAT
jgi:hypothetical protein